LKTTTSVMVSWVWYYYYYHPPWHHNTTISTVLQHIIDSYQHAQATSPTAIASHFYCIKIVTVTLCHCDFLLCILPGLSTV